MLRIFTEHILLLVRPAGARTASAFDPVEDVTMP